MPNDPAALRQMVLGLLEEAAEQERRLQQLQHWLEQLLRARYGPRRERINENQLFLFAVALVSAGQETPPHPESPTGEQEEETRRAKRKGHGRQPLPQSFERRRVVHDLTEEERQCPQCQEEFKRIDGPEAFLKEFRGFLQADAYSGYDHFYKEPRRGIVEVACWAHARRKFFEAQSSDLMRSLVMLAYLRLLYDVEREADERELNGEARRALRQEKAKPILDDIHAYLEREQPRVLPKSPEGEAIAYTLSNWKALTRYCDDGALEIDNNGAERSLRGVAVGRKNWMFSGSDNGGRTAAVLTSLIATAKRLALDPFAYLRDIFAPISDHPKNHLNELLPDQWQAEYQSASTT